MSSEEGVERGRAEKRERLIERLNSYDKPPSRHVSEEEREAPSRKVVVPLGVVAVLCAVALGALLGSAWHPPSGGAVVGLAIGLWWAYRIWSLARGHGRGNERPEGEAPPGYYSQVGGGGVGGVSFSSLCLPKHAAKKECSGIRSLFTVLPNVPPEEMRVVDWRG